MKYSFHELSAVNLVAGLASGRWTSVELTEHFLKQIEKFNPQIHAVPFVFAEQALAQARASDARRAAGKPLSRCDGLPMTIKDAIRVKDSVSTYGIWLFKNYRPSQDSQLIGVLRRSGLVFLGRTAVPTGAFDWNCVNSVYAECVNPYDSKRVPGGSSGGAAAALAKGLTPMDLGSDLGGSIRYPAHCCGVYGLRTTDGWLPIDDVGPERFTTPFKQLVTFGPMTRFAEDLALLLELFAEEFPISAVESSAFANENLKVAYSDELLGLKPETSTLDLLDQFLERLARRGHEVTKEQPALDFAELLRDWGLIVGYEFASGLPWFARSAAVKGLYEWWILDHRIGRGDFTTHFKAGMRATEADFVKACDRRQHTFATLEEFFIRNALWILPVAPAPALLRAQCGHRIETAQGKFDYAQYVGSYLVPTAVLGTPALTVPIGKVAGGLPVGVQIHGPRFSDRWLVKTAERL